MGRFRIHVSGMAERQLKKLPSEARDRVVRAVRALADDPVPRGSRRLTGYDDVFRVRIGPYRVLYSVAASTLTILVLKIGHRRDIYR